MNRLHFRVLLATTLLMAVSLLSAKPEAAGPAGEALPEECNKEFPKVTTCLDFASGKAAKPTKQCCDAVEGIKERDPKCLCYIIQQTNNGGQAMKDLGLQEDKLLQLPTSCQLRNASIAICPGLLGIPPSSPDAAIFSGNATSGSSPPVTSSSKQNGVSASTSSVGHVAVIVAFALQVTVSVISALVLA